MAKFILAVSRAVLWGGGLLALLATSGMSAVAVAEESSPTAAELTAKIQLGQRQIRLILGDVLNHGTFDVPTVVDTVGQDPEVLARWVRNQTTHVPYQGLVRGEFGVLQDRLGNHLDRAMLLGRLIEATGRSVRLEVREPQAPPAPFPLLEKRPGPVALTEETRELLVRLGTLPDEPLSSPSQLPGWNRFDQDLQVRAASLLEQLAGDPGFPVWHEQERQREPWSDPRVRVWWEDDQGRWLSADLGETAQGEERTSPPQTAPAEESLSLAVVSRQYAHRYEIAVVAERWQEGDFERVTLLEHDFEAHALAMQAIRIGVVPDEFEVADFYTDDPDQALADDLLANTAWIPYLRYGEDLVLGDLIDEEGTIRDPLQPSQARQLEEATSLLGSISVRGLAEDGAPRGAFIGLSLEVTHRQGDEVVNRLLRPWFSLAGEETPVFELEHADRLERAVALLRDTNMLLQVAEPSEVLLWRHELGTFLRNAHALQGVIMALDDADFETLDGAIHELVDLPQTAMQFARHRFTASLYPGRFYIGEPNILIEHTGLKQWPEGFRDYRAIDLAHVPLHLVPGDDDARHLRLAQGVLETLLEAELLVQRNPAPGRERVLEGENAALHLETAMASGETGLWLVPGEARQFDNLVLPRLSRLAIQEQLDYGYYLYFPLQTALDKGPGEESLPLAWWALDPASGEVLGYGGIGWGNMTDYAYLLHARVYLFKTSLASTVAKSAAGSATVCAVAAALLSVQLLTTTGEPGLLDIVTDQSERLLKFCLEAYSRRMNPRLPPGS